MRPTVSVMTWEESADVPRWMIVGRWLEVAGEMEEKMSGSGFEEVLDAARLRESLLVGRARALIESEE
jgi:hypothetical protein